LCTAKETNMAQDSQAMDTQDIGGSSGFEIPWFAGGQVQVQEKGMLYLGQVRLAKRKGFEVTFEFEWVAQRTEEGWEVEESIQSCVLSLASFTPVELQDSKQIVFSNPRRASTAILYLPENENLIQRDEVHGL